MMAHRLLLLWLLLFLIRANGVKLRRLKTSLGVVEGRELPGHGKTRIGEFLGLRYVEPQRERGVDRWRAPRSKTAWREVVKLTKYGAVCPQPRMSQRTGIRYNNTSEDCLFMNIWAPLKASSEPFEKKLPMMVFIYGGASI